MYTAFNFSIVFGVVIGWIRFHKTDPAFLPFLVLLTAGLINEVLSFVLIMNDSENMTNRSVYRALEAYLIMWQLARWGLFAGKSIRLWTIIALLTICWVAEMALTRSGSVYAPYCNILVALLVVILCIEKIGDVVWSDNQPLWRSPVFLICSAFVFYNVYAILVEVFLLFGVDQSTHFNIEVYFLMVIINLFVNLILTWAILCLPKRAKYFMPL